MIEPRTLQEAQAEYLRALAEADTPVNLDTSQGTVVHALSRGSGAVASQLDTRFAELQAGFLTEAAGERLDLLASSFGLSRLLPSYSEGSVLVISNSTELTVTPDTRLLELATGLEFVVQNTSPVSVNTLSETVLPVKAAQTGTASNLPAGRLLYSANSPDIRFTVGSSRTTFYVGDLVGGSDGETDDELRARVGLFLASRATGSAQELLLKLLEYDQVDRAFVKTAVGGFVEFWVDSVAIFTPTELDQLKVYISEFVSAGIIPVVSQASRKPVAFELVVQPLRSSTLNLQTLTSTLRSVVRSLIDSLGLGEPLLRTQVITAVRPFVRSVEVRSMPPIIEAANSEVLVIGDIKVTYPLNT